MKKLKDFENDINKCSKCGLCQGACPIYKLTGNECAVSKGKFVMLSGVLKGDLQLNANINSYLDLCTKCGKCSEFCPAGINVCEILQTAKYEYISKQPWFKFLHIFHKLFDTVIRHCRSPFSVKSTGTREILYFKGCVNKIYPRTENALKQILNRTGIKLLDAGFSCCGLPFFSAGNLEQFEDVKARNSALINSSAADTILTDCASCESTLKSYRTLDKPIMNAETLIAELGLKFRFKKHYKVAFHKPCHLENTDFLQKLMANCENIEFIEIPETCCGLAGEFFLKKPKIANKIAKKRAEEIINSDAEIVLTSCPACVIGLKKAFFGKKIKVMNIIDFLKKGL